MLSKLQKNFKFLNESSDYKSDFDLSIYEFFHSKNLFSNGVPSGAPELMNAISDCSQCYYGLQIDSYVNGCFHDCQYCWAKTDLTKSNQWNNPMPVPIDITEFWKILYTIFETNEPHALRAIIEKRTPLRIGSLSDPFMTMDKKYNVTLEMLKILNHYDYPVVILTRSHHIVEKRYLDVMNPKLVAIQISLPSLNEEFTKLLEPGAPSPIKRLEALKVLSDLGFWTTVRLNPLFPIYPDGKYSRNIESDFSTDFFSFKSIETLYEYGCKSLLTGFVHLEDQVIKLIENKTQINLYDMMSNELKEEGPGFRYSNSEIRKYYELIKEECQKFNIEFTTCYLGLGEPYYWKDQDLWDNKDDCCNIKNRLESFKTDTQMIPIVNRLEISNVEMSYFQKRLHSFWQSFKSYFLKKIFESSK
ncbi:hypothetical protein A9Q84_19890 [Halobacteriovorax marinus]|uniref:Radical SAM core domain-containing protein n=1 Tax=Halobacteriovorax marinus TaxID=97084 RepID=A0A1Y5F2S1_9BACT|nr:hypothetical protein A9Q84_19890 [Halobacteriovorax marinus]